VQVKGGILPQTTTPLATLVEVETMHTQDYPIVIETLGQVKPAVEVSLRSQVSGTIINTTPAFTPGKVVSSGEVLIQIDPKDYELALQKQEALYQQAQASYAIEQGQQQIAQNELSLLFEVTGQKPEDTTLALRAPQLAQVEAALENARVDLDMARLDVQRTTISAPFDALITERLVGIGDNISTQDKLSTLVATDRYWVTLAVPLQQLTQLQLPKKRIYQPGVSPRVIEAEVLLQGTNHRRKAYVLGTTGVVNEDSRLAEILVAIPDPLLLKGKAQHKQETMEHSTFSLGDYVKVLLPGKRIKNGIRLPLAWLREGNAVWLMVDGTLKRKKLTPVYQDQKYAYFTQGLTTGDTIITSELVLVVDGMPVRTQDTDSTDQASD
jgi:multidrug efflux pump subunit AcrA (membrane-fusion protein)